VGSDLSARKARARIETNTVSTRASVDLNFSSIGLEVVSSIFGGDTALDGKAALGDGLLGETELGKGCASSDLDLGRDDVEASDLL
jgi:hypothetical protein